MGTKTLEQELAEIVREIESRESVSGLDSISIFNFELARARFFSPCRVYSKKELAEINKRLIKTDKQ